MPPTTKVAGLHGAIFAMKITINASKNGQPCINEYTVQPGEVYKTIASCLSEIDIPSTLRCSVSNSSSSYVIIYDVKERGTYTENGVTKPSMFITETRDSFKDTFEARSEFVELPEVYLTCIHPESNNYKFYHMKPTPNGVECDYGRIGAAEGDRFGRRSVREPYPLSMFWIRYYEKLSKGYIDNSAAYLKKDGRVKKKAPAAKPSETNTVPVREEEIQLYKTLLAYAKHYVRETLTSVEVTIGQVSAAKKVFRDMCNRKTVKGFNNQVLKLVQISPRRCLDAIALLAVSEKDFAKIIEREETLLNAMIAVATGDTSTTSVATTPDSFKNGVEVYIATAEQKAMVLGHLSDTLKPKVAEIYRVVPTEQTKRFEEYVKDNKIEEIKMLWHGSVNANWLSIIENSLSMSVGVANGRMFGDGIYFAPSSMKSWNYTSYRGTTWARGTSSEAFMGLYATAYGTPQNVNTAVRHSAASLQQLGKNCLHAHAGPALHADEIIFYSENAVCLQYIVKFR